MCIVGFLRLQSLRYKNKRENGNLIAKKWQSCEKKMVIDLLLVRWIFGRQIGHKNYEDFEHPTRRGTDASSMMFRMIAGPALRNQEREREHGETN